MITINSERPNIVRGKNPLIQPRGRSSGPPADRPSGSVPGSAQLSGTGVPIAPPADPPASVAPERITGAADRLQIAREARVALDLAAQPRHLDVDVADIAAELRRQRQFLARDRLRRLLRQGEQQCRLGRRQMYRFAA